MLVLDFNAHQIKKKSLFLTFQELFLFDWQDDFLTPMAANIFSLPFI